jgi:predicted permease
MLLETVLQDIRYTLRTLRKDPVFAGTAILTFALGIGVTTAIFTIVHGVLLKPLPYHEPDKIVHVATGTATRYEEMKPAAKSYDELGVYFDRPGDITLSGNGEPEVLKLARVSANFLSILGVEPVLGRPFLPEDDVTGAPRVVMISADLWRRKFGGDASILGKPAILAGGPAPIIGVLPDGFQFPFPTVDVWLTRPTEGVTPATPLLSVFGRLKPEIDAEQASAELAVLTGRYAQAHPEMLDAKSNAPPHVTMFKDRLVGGVRSMLWMLFGAVGFVLLIACANAASLLLARSHSRSREFAVRAAIGANRRRLFRQLLVESLILACTGGALGVLTGNWSLSAITSMTALDLPRISQIRLDGTVLGFATSLSVAVGVLFGLLPSLGGSKTDLTRALKSPSDRGSFSSRSRSFLVTAQVALSIILLIGATLLMQSMVRLYQVDLHFNPQDVLTMQLSLSPLRYDTNLKRVVFSDELTNRVESQPGVQSVGIAWTLPFMGWPGTPVHPAERPLLPLNQRLIAVLNSVNAGYFQTLQIPLRRGRLFSVRDDLNAAPVVVINETLARQFWPQYPGGEDPVGRPILIGANPKPSEIIGIVADILLAPGTDIRPAVYWNYRQNPVPVVALTIRTDRTPMRFAGSIRDQVRAIDGEQAITATKPLDGLLDDALGQRRLVMTLLEIFAGVALLIAMVGVYGVIAHGVTQRTREVGVRMALGARPGNIVLALAGQAFWITALGIAVGLGGAFGLTHFLKSYLFEVSPTEAKIFAAVALLFVIAASAASYFPLRRAARLDPMTVLRHE